MKKYLMFGHDELVVNNILSRGYEIHLVLDKWDLMDDIKKSSSQNEKWFVVNDSTNIENVLEVIHHNNPNIQYDLIFSRYESTIIIAATLSKFLAKNDFVDLKTAMAFRDKFTQKNTLKDVVDVTNFQLIENVLNFETKNLVLKFPIILKPYNGAGTALTFLVNNEEELKDKFAIFEKENKLTILAEEFINGDEFQIDGYILNDELKFLVSKYEKPVLNIKDGFLLKTITFNPNLNVQMYETLRSIIFKSLKALKLNNSVFHLEMFYTKDNKWIFSECGIRIGGALSNDLFESTYGLSLSSVLCNCLDKKSLEKNIKANNFYYGYSYIQPLNQSIKKLPEFDDLKKEFPFLKKVVYEWKPGEPLPDIKINSVKRTGMVLVEGKTRDEVRNFISIIHKYFETLKGLSNENRNNK